jgi:FdhD protein
MALVILDAAGSQGAAGSEPRKGETVPVRVVKVEAGSAGPAEDVLAVEEPLEIRLGFGPNASRQHQTISLTMRTPGSDRELAAGFLFTEGIVRSRAELAEVFSCGPLVPPGGHQNVVRVELQPEVEVELGRLQRHFYTTSSCGVCGKTSLEALAVAVDRPALAPDFVVRAETLVELPERLRAAQAVFGRTGGLHAAALFDPDGRLLGVREDVGRHNALDKLIGAELLDGRLPLRQQLLLLSGRASFELLQKAFVAGAPLVAAVGAPSSLAVELAERFGITLVGWLRGGRFSIYSHPERIRAVQGAEFTVQG